MDEVTKETSGEVAERQLTDKELEAILKQSEGKTDFPSVSFDEFEIPTYEEWVEACNALLKGKPFDKIMYTPTYEGVTFSPVYTLRTGPDAKEAILPTDDYPGMGDFLRGSRAHGYKEDPWGIAQSCDEALPKENNELLKHEIDRGSTVYNVKLDDSTLHGIDVFDAKKPGETGVVVTTLEDMNEVLSGLDLEKYPFMMFAGASALAPLALVAASLKAQGKDPATVHGVIGASPLTQLIIDGKNAESLDSYYDDMAETIRYARAHMPHVATVFPMSDVFSLGGAQAVQEVAYTFGVAVEYIRQMQKRGISIHDIAQSLYFGFNTGATFFTEISKLRAARQVWSNIMAAFGAEEEDRSMKIHAKPAFFTKTIFDVGVNMLRNTTQAFSAVVGGVDTYENAPYDDTIRKGDEFSRRIARNLQIMLQEEFGMLRPIDAAGGSWAMETLTKELAEKIWAEFQKVEGMGGIVAALSEGYPQKEIDAVLQKRFKALDLRKDSAVGNNMYPLMGEELLEARPEDTEEIKKTLSEAANKYRADLDVGFRSEKLAALRKAPEGKAVEYAMEAAAAGATLAEINEAAGKGDVSIEIPKILPHRWTERYEALRFDTEHYKEKTGKNVEVFLANMGKIPQHKARADFSTSFLQVGEFNVHLNTGFQDDEDKPGSRWDKCVEALKAGCDEAGTPYDVAVICSTDATYPEDVPALAPRLKEVLGDGTLFLAGAAPKELEPVYKDAGVDDFISVKANCYEILRMLQKKKGMIE